MPLHNTLAVQSPPWAHRNPYAHQVRSTHRCFPNLCLPALACRWCAQCSMLVARALLPPRYGSLARAAGSTLRDPFLTALAKAALLPRIISALDDLPHTPSPPRAHAAFNRLARGPHARSRRWGRGQRKRGWRRTQSTQFGTHSRARFRYALSGPHAMPQLVHSAWSTPECVLRPYDAQYRSAWLSRPRVLAQVRPRV